VPILPPMLVAKLDPLIRRLASTHDGEIIATVRALERRLRAAHFDLNDLAETVAQQSPPPASKSQTKKPRDENSSDDDWHAIREFCLVRRGLLRGRELEFVLGLGDWRGDLTSKQHDWLIAIAGRLRRATA
jgi:hypothetical protein